MKPQLLLILTVLAALAPATSRAADDAKLRETLRALTLRLRSAETDRNNLLSEKAQLEEAKKILTARVDALAKQAASDKDTIATLTTKNSDQEATLAQTKEALDKWKTGYDQLTVLAQKEKAEHEKYAGEAILLRRKVADREMKNLELYKLANEILTRYEKFSLGEALAAREPFTGIARVKLENLVQDYSDKIADNRAKMEPLPAAPATTRPQASPAPSPQPSRSR